MASQNDKKTSVVTITSITTQDNKKYVLPDTEKLANYHNELIKTIHFKRVKKSFNQRGQEKVIWITCTDEMEKIYFD